MPETAVLTGV